MSNTSIMMVDNVLAFSGALKMKPLRDTDAGRESLTSITSLKNRQNVCRKKYNMSLNLKLKIESYVQHRNNLYQLAL